ncbi:pentatricopeptide repeat-containing protein At5g16640, mitochondrial-like [Magnolia sinica]|uniref:pentatricopeptide repeat-containing protein At5g16640, mitochondrial-like n=1 Tax=Magnolia sinica TaxID=86752 RepID=UPI0026591049|nr:pentatricopeptide repeat-containing protein At5g16640, mitochondrial-like [Magnolia sinica]
MENGLYLTVVTLNILLNCFCHDSRVYKAKSMLDRSIELEWDIGVVGYNTVLSGFCRIGGRLRVLNLLASIFKRVIAPNTRTYNIVIHSLCKARMVGDACEVSELFVRMDMEKIVPNMFTYTIIICSLCKEGKFLEATDLFAKSIEHGCLPDLVAYTALVDGLVKNRMFSEGLQLLNRMLEQGLVLNVVLYDLLIRAFCREGFCGSWKMSHVSLLLDKMLVNR